MKEGKKTGCVNWEQVYKTCSVSLPACYLVKTRASREEEEEEEEEERGQEEGGGGGGKGKGEANVGRKHARNERKKK